MRRFSFLTLLAALLIVGCAEVTIEQSNPLTEINSLPDLTASFADEGETRTFVEDSKYLRWHESDHITAFFGNTLNRQYKFKGKTGDNSGTFSLVPTGELGTGNDLSYIYAVYPYDENTTITDNGVISLTLPATQTYAENSFGKGANTMVAVTESVEDTFLSFKNVCGYLKLKLYGDNVTIVSIEVKGNNEEKIAGSATATMELGGVPTIAMNDEATTSVTLDCGEGVSIGATADMATEFWIVLPETTFEGGITITATNTDGAVFSKSTTNTVVITRNDIQPMVALKAEFATVKPANNEIWYTNGSTTEATTPYKTDVFGANIVSNTYDADKECWVIEFDSDVTKIGDNAFYNCSSLTSVTIPNCVKAIVNSAFARCSNIVSMSIPASVTEIGFNAFYECDSLTNISIPNSITSIEDGTFYGCDNLASITIPDCVGFIGYSAFNGCSSLKTITIPDSVTTIEAYAFYDCDSLTSISTLNGITSIGHHVFSGCSLLTNVTIPDSVTSIEASTFEGCSSLTNITIPDSVSSIGSDAFRYCSSLASITIPDSVTSIGTSAFSGCSSLEEVYCKAKTPPTGGYYMFDFNASVRKIYVPIESIDTYKSAEYWSEYAGMIEGYNFESGEVVPETPLRPANNEIWYTNDSTTEPTALYKTDVFDVNVISNTYDVDKKCWVIKFDGEVTKIGSHAFQECSCINSVTIPNSVTKIGAYAFNGCTNLVSIIIPDGVTSIEENAFAMCRNLTNITIPQGVSEIKRWSFYGCTNLIGVTIPDSVIYIGQCAFAYCSNLQSVSIPIGITTIESDAFSFCSTLTSITIPSTVEYIGDSAFRGCSNLTAFYGKFASDDNRCLVLNGVLNSFAPSGLELYDIPSNVTTIGTSSFQYCDSLNSVTIPNSVKVIEAWAFQCCNGLKNINIPNGTTTIGNYAFSYCNSLTSVAIPNSVNSIGYSAFDGCANLKIVWSKNLTPPTAIFSEDNIWNAFEGCHADLAISVPSQSYDAFKTAPGWSDYKSSIVDDGYILEDDYFEDLEDF